MPRRRSWQLRVRVPVWGVQAIQTEVAPAAGPASQLQSVALLLRRTASRCPQACTWLRRKLLLPCRLLLPQLDGPWSTAAPPLTAEAAEAVAKLQPMLQVAVLSQLPVVVRLAAQVLAVLRRSIHQRAIQSAWVSDGARDAVAEPLSHSVVQ